MRGRLLCAAICSLPLANALSLGNFQEITSNLIPRICSNAYNDDIEVCTVDDFNKGCSDECKRSLVQKGLEVTNACAGIIVNSRSLLGIVQAGGIVPALCIGVATTSTTQRATPTPVPTLRPPVTTTGLIQTTTPRIIRPSTFTFPTSSTTLETSTLSFPPSTTDIIDLPTTTAPPPVAGIGNPLTTTRVAPAPVTTRGPNTPGENGSGGGSPFDIVGSGNQFSHSSLASSLIAIGWTLIFLAR